MSDEEFLIVQAWVNEILTLPEKTTDTARQSRSTERLKRIVEQTNVLEPGQGGGRQGRSVNINMQKMHFVTHEAHRQGSESIESTSTSETPSMQCRRP